MPNPPRPTPARLRSLRTRIDKLITECDTMLQGNVHSKDSYRLAGVRDARDDLRGARENISNITPKESP